MRDYWFDPEDHWVPVSLVILLLAGVALIVLAVTGVLPGTSASSTVTITIQR